MVNSSSRMIQCSLHSHQHPYQQMSFPSNARRTAQRCEYDDYCFFCVSNSLKHCVVLFDWFKNCATTIGNSNEAYVLKKLIATRKVDKVLVQWFSMYCSSFTQCSRFFEHIFPLDCAPKIVESNEVVWVDDDRSHLSASTPTSIHLHLESRCAAMRCG